MGLIGEQASSIFPREHLNPGKKPPERSMTFGNQQAFPAESSDPIGVIVCKQSMHRHLANRGYIAMLSVSRDWRKRGIGSLIYCSSLCFLLTLHWSLATALVRNALDVMKQHGVEEVLKIVRPSLCLPHQFRS
jgi:GNAT superfamily N-acetyltransferase